MKTLKYIWRNVARNKLRSALTIVSIGFSLALLTLLVGYMAMQSVWENEAGRHHRIVVMNTQGFAGLVPIAYVDRVRQFEGVRAAVPYSWFGGNYKEEKMPFAQFATDPEYAFAVWDEYQIDPAQLKAWQTNRQGCVADRRLVERRGWKIGERIPLQGAIYPVALDLELVGVFDAPQNTDSLWFNWYYLDELLKQKVGRGDGNAGTVFAKTERSDLMASLSKTIDDRFSSSDNPTRTQTEAAFAKMFTDMLGNIQAYIRNIGLAVVFSLSLVAGNTMAMSIRERTTEIAVLKALGFSRLRVLWMVLGESCGIALLGGLLGILIGCLCLQGLHQLSPQFFPVAIGDLVGSWLLWMVALALGIGLVSGIVPAVRAAQLSVIDGLRRVI
ncbi:MAG: ABC transporter permease [Pirellulales bacterium]